MTQVIASVAIAVFTVIMVVIGVFSAKHTTTMDGFLLGGRKIGPWLSAFAYGTAYFSAVIFIGYAGKHGWDIGIGSIWIGVGNALFGGLLAWMLLAKRTRAMTRSLAARTMPEFFEARYDDSRMKVYSALIIFVFLLPYAASVYKGLGVLFSVVFPGASDLIPGVSGNVICMFIVAALTGIYLVLGGYVATVITDFVQGIIMLIGVVLMIITIVNHPNVGGLQNAMQVLKDTEPALVDIFGGGNWKFLCTNILLTSFGTWGLPQMVSKFYSLKDEKSVKIGSVVTTVFALVIGCGAYFTGIFGRFFVEAAPNGAPVTGFDGVVPSMLVAAFGDGIGGNILLSVILLLVLSASMSTLSSVVLTSSSAVSVDLMRVFKPDIDPKRMMRLTRMLCIAFVALSFIFATFNFAIIASIMAFSWGIVSGCFIGPYIWGLYSKKITRAGAWAGMLGGFATVVTMTLITMFTSPALSEGAYAAFKAASANSPVFGVSAMAVSIVIVPIVSAFTKKLPAKVVQAAFES